MSESQFLSGWRSRLEHGETGLSLVGLGHALDIFVGSNDLGHPKVTIQSKSKPRMPVISGIVLVDRHEGAQGYWQLSLTLQDLKFQEVFLRLVDDVYTRSDVASTAREAHSIVDGVFDEWRRLLKPRPAGVLTKEELRGLVGELWLLLNRFAMQRPIDQAITGWLGPLGAHQDFWYEASGLHEAKSIGPTMSAVKITSEFQLDPLDEDLELIVLRVPDASEDAAGAFSLQTLVAEVDQALEAASVGRDDLETRLARLGVDLDNKYYSDNWFLVSSVANYSVPNEFPSIRASRMDEGVEKVVYRVELGVIESFKTSFETIV